MDFSKIPIVVLFVIECSWFLLEEGLKRKNESIISFTETVFNDAFERDWDK